MQKSIAASMLSHMGFIGTTGVSSLLPRPSTPQANQELLRDFTDAGKIADPDVWSKYNTVMKRPATFEAMLNLWDEMANWEMVATILLELVEEASQVDPNSPATLWYQCNDKDVEQDLNDMLVNIRCESIIQAQLHNTAALGNSFAKIEYAPGVGVTGLSPVHPLDIRRCWLEKSQRCVGFRWSGHNPSKEAAFVMPDGKTTIPRWGMTDGKSTEDLWYPFDFMHIRRIWRNWLTQHGEPVLCEAEGIYKKLKIAIDQMVVHRAQVQPDRYVIGIDTGDQAPAEQVKTVQRWKQSLRSKIAFGQGLNPEGMSRPTDFSSFYNAWSLDTVLYLAKPRGVQHIVDKLDGTSTIPDVYDIELLWDQFYSTAGVPRSYFNAKESGDSPSGKALLATDMRFLRKVKSIRKPVMEAYTELGYMHAILKGKNAAELDIRAHMPPVGGLEEQMQIELLMKQGELLALMGDIMDKYSLPREAWVEVIFRRYLHLPDEVVNVFITALPPEMSNTNEGKEQAPATRALIREVHQAICKNPNLYRLANYVKEASKRISIKEQIEENQTKSKRSYMEKNLFSSPEAETNDRVMTDYGNAFSVSIEKVSTGAKPTVTVPIMENFGKNEKTDFKPTIIHESDKSTEPAYRKYISFNS